MNESALEQPAPPLGQPRHPGRTRPAWLRALLLLAGLAGGIALLVLAARGVDARATLAVLASGNGALIAAAVACNVAILLIGAMLWRTLLPARSPVAFGRMLEVVSIMAAIVNTVPALVGHVSGTALLAGERGVGARASVAVLALDQLGEALAKVAVLSAAALLLPLPAWMRAAVGGIAVIAVLMLGALVVAARLGAAGDARDARDARDAHDAGDAQASRTAHAWLDRLRSWCADLEVLRSPRRAAGALLLVLAMKAAEAAALLVVQAALGVELPPGSALLVLGAVNLATMVPVSPGNVGTYEAAAVAAYRWLGVDESAALALAVASHACYLMAMVGSGAVAAAVRSARAARGG